MNDLENLFSSACHLYFTRHNFQFSLAQFNDIFFFVSYCSFLFGFYWCKCQLIPSISPSRTGINVKRVKKVVFADPWLTVRMIANRLDIKNDNVWKFITEDLGKCEKIMDLCMLKIQQFLAEWNIAIPKKVPYSPRPWLSGTSPYRKKFPIHRDLGWVEHHHTEKRSLFTEILAEWNIAIPKQVPYSPRSWLNGTSPYRKKFPIHRDLGWVEHRHTEKSSLFTEILAEWNIAIPKQVPYSPRPWLSGTSPYRKKFPIHRDLGWVEHHHTEKSSLFTETLAEWNIAIPKKVPYSPRSWLNGTSPYRKKFPIHRDLGWVEHRHTETSSLFTEILAEWNIAIPKKVPYSPRPWLNGTSPYRKKFPIHRDLGWMEHRHTETSSLFTETLAEWNITIPKKFPIHRDLGWVEHHHTEKSSLFTETLAEWNIAIPKQVPYSPRPWLSGTSPYRNKFPIHRDLGWVEHRHTEKSSLFTEILAEWNIAIPKQVPYSPRPWLSGTSPYWKKFPIHRDLGWMEHRQTEKSSLFTEILAEWNIAIPKKVPYSPRPWLSGTSPYWKKYGGCPRGVMVKAMNCGIVVREFVLQSRYYVHFRANTLGKGMNPLFSLQLWINSRTD